jgi:hypothetical protein
MRRAAEVIQRIEEERERKNEERQRKMDSDVQSALQSLKDVGRDGGYTPGLKTDDDFAFRPKPEPGTITLFDRGTKDSAPVDTRFKGRSRLDVGAQLLAPKDLTRLFPKPGVPPVQAPDPKDLEYLFPMDTGLQVPAADDLRFLFQEDGEKGRTWPGPANHGVRLYNPLREPDRAALDFDLDSAIVQREEKKGAKGKDDREHPKYERAKKFLNAEADWGDFRREVFASCSKIPLNRGPVFMGALRERANRLYKEYGEAYGRLLFMTIDECRDEYKTIADQRQMPLSEFISKAQQDPAMAKLRDEAWGRVDERRNKKLEALITLYKAELESELGRLLTEQDPKK